MQRGVSLAGFLQCVAGRQTHHPFEGVLMGDEDGKFFSSFGFIFLFPRANNSLPWTSSGCWEWNNNPASSSVSRAPTELSRAEKRLLPARPSRHVVQRPPLLRRCEDEGHAGPHVGQPGESGSHRRRGSRGRRPAFYSSLIYKCRGCIYGHRSWRLALKTSVLVLDST